LCRRFDKDKDGKLTLEEFTQTIEYFGNLESEEEQYKCERFAWSAALPTPSRTATHGAAAHPGRPPTSTQAPCLGPAS
jgi:hypothetical protein